MHSQLGYIANIINNHRSPQKQMELIIEAGITHGTEFAMAVSLLHGVKKSDHAVIASVNAKLYPFGIILSQFCEYIISTNDIGQSSTGFIFN